VSRAEPVPEPEGPQAWLLARGREQRLSPTQRRVLQCLLDALPGVAFLSAAEVAEQAGVSQPTVTRFAHALGHRGWSEFRAALREVVLAAPAAAGPAPAPDEPFDHRVAALDDERANLETLRRSVGGGGLDAAVALLAGTRPFGILGLRASAALAEHLGYFARRVLPGVRVLTDGSTAEDGVLQLHADGATALLVLALPRYPAATVRALRQARAVGLATVVVADTPLVPFAADADVLLVAPVGRGLVFDSHAAAVVLAMSLLDAVAASDPQRTQARLEAHEALVEGWEHVER